MCSLRNSSRSMPRLLPMICLFAVGGLAGLWLTDAGRLAVHLAADSGWWMALLAAAILVPVCYSGVSHFLGKLKTGLFLIAAALVTGLASIQAVHAHTWISGALSILSAVLIGLLLVQTISLSVASTEDRFVVSKVVQDFLLLYLGGFLQLALLLTASETGSLSTGRMAMPLLALLCGVAWFTSGNVAVRNPDLLAPAKRKHLWRNNVWRNSLVAALFLGIGLGVLWEAAPMLVLHYKSIGAVMAERMETLASPAPSRAVSERVDVAMVGATLAVAILIAGSAVWWVIRQWRSRPVFNVLTAISLAALMGAVFSGGLTGFAGFITGCTLFALIIPFAVAYSFRYLSANVPLAASIWLAIAIIGYTLGTATSAQVLSLGDPGLTLLLPALCITVLMWFSADGSRFRPPI